MLSQKNQADDIGTLLQISQPSLCLLTIIKRFFTMSYHSDNPIKGRMRNFS
jgi:hypothetical protein